MSVRLMSMHTYEICCEIQYRPDRSGIIRYTPSLWAGSRERSTQTINELRDEINQGRKRIKKGNRERDRQTTGARTPAHQSSSKHRSPTPIMLRPAHALRPPQSSQETAIPFCTATPFCTFPAKYAYRTEFMFCRTQVSRDATCL